MILTASTMVLANELGAAAAVLAPPAGELDLTLSLTNGALAVIGGAIGAYAGTRRGEKRARERDRRAALRESSRK